MEIKLGDRWLIRGDGLNWMTYRRQDADREGNPIGPRWVATGDYYQTLQGACMFLYRHAARNDAGVCDGLEDAIERLEQIELRLADAVAGAMADA